MSGLRAGAPRRPLLELSGAAVRGVAQRGQDEAERRSVPGVYGTRSIRRRPQAQRDQTTTPSLVVWRESSVPAWGATFA
ncbi:MULTISPECIES: hypothetical protein [Actinomadura]|uniref:Uncharacterized protein n=1 Tax=Actinomadura yumaensis TaxID=111807 RepID=A0ABW2CTE1_9ACTN|nr:hypothetical protein [Actinomadura sp. J1-007]